MRLLDLDESFSEPIRAILNHAIVTSTALYDYVPRPPEAMVGWFAAKRAGDFPVIGLVTDDGQLAGFASFGTFRAFPAYKYTVEHSVYVAEAFRGQGVARRLLTALIDRAEQQNKHTLIGVIDASNAASIRLHESFGFKLTGTLPQAGYKFGRWLDVCFYQLLLETPTNPQDG
ncbi:MAG: GNAT family N-acetyltransferase [Tepidisphaeraceae bacterium]